MVEIAATLFVILVGYGILSVIVGSIHSYLDYRHWLAEADRKTRLGYSLRDDVDQRELAAIRKRAAASVGEYIPWSPQ